MLKNESVNMAVLAPWSVLKYHNQYFVHYWHYVYINFLSNRYNMIYLLAPTLEVLSLKEGFYKIELNNLYIKEMPYYKKYMEGIKFAKCYFQNIKKMNNVDFFYCIVPAPYCWMPKLLFKKKCIMHYVGDSIDTTLKNKHWTLRKKIFYITCYLPEYLLTLIASKFSNVFTNGFVIYKRLKKLKINSTPVISSLLMKEDFYKKKFKFNGNFLYVGYIRYAKGLETLADVIFMLKKKGLNVKLDIVGDGEFKEKLIQIIRSKFLEQSIIFHGFIGNREKLKKFYRRSDIFLFSSLSEGSPRVVIEAMANSLPVVSTPVGGLPYIFKDNQHIKFADFNNTDSFVKRILEYITDYNITQQIVNNAFEKVQNEFTLEKYFSKVFERGGK